MSPRWKIIVILAAIVLVSGVTGGFVGFQSAKAIFRKRSNPEAWNVQAMNKLESGLHPTPEQRVRMQAILDGGVEEFKGIRIETIANRYLELLLDGLGGSS